MPGYKNRPTYFNLYQTGGRMLHNLTQLTQSALDSAINQHLVDNPMGAGEYHENWFDILHRVHSRHMLRIVGTVKIKLRRPTLCRLESFSLFPSSFGKTLIILSARPPPSRPSMILLQVCNQFY